MTTMSMKCITGIAVLLLRPARSHSPSFLPAIFHRPFHQPGLQLPNLRSRFYSSSQTSKACPSCGSPLDLREISCGKCGSLSAVPENINYLSLFGFSQKEPFEFDLDVGKLRREYLRLMSKVHPDSVIDKSEVSVQIDSL